MKLSRIFSSVPKRIAAGALIALAIALPAATLAADTVAITADTTVANSTVNPNTMNWGKTTAASFDQVVAVQVVYNNSEEPQSGKTANNLRVKINIPTASGKSQTVTTSTKADNSNTVTGSATINLDRADAYLQYIPGTATWKHAETANGPMTVTQKVSDAVVTDANGLVLENENPCQAGSIVVQARVVIPGVKIVKEVQIHGQDNKWSNANTAKAGDTLDYMITYENTGNTTEKNVVIRDALPNGLALVAGSTKVFNNAYPNGQTVDNDNIVAGGITIGDYVPTQVAYITFRVTVPANDKLTCGANIFRNVGVAHPQDMPEYYNIAVTTVTKECQNTPTYKCEAFNVIVDKTNRSVKVDQFKFTASDNTKLDSVLLNWGDSNSVTTNSVIGQSHTYTKDGSYTISLSSFKVGGKTVDVSGNCSQVVNFTTTTTPPTTPPTTPTKLPNTGAGDVIGIFGAVTVLGAFAHRLFLSRRLAR